MAITLKSDGDVSIIQMDDGKVNVFSPDMIKQFSDILDQVPSDKGSVLIVGREGMFSAGFDLKVMMSSPENAAAMVKSGFRLLMKVFTFPRPIVAACSGHAIALGAFLLCSCDYRLGVKGDFKIGANETIRIPGLFKESLMDPSSFEIELPTHLRAPSISASSSVNLLR